MQRYFGLDAHAASCTLAIISETGKRLRDFSVETNGAALVEAIRAVPGPRHLILEEGTPSAWLYETLGRQVDEIVVTGVNNSRGPKCDARDAYALAETLRINAWTSRCSRLRRSLRCCASSRVCTACSFAMSCECRHG